MALLLALVSLDCEATWDDAKTKGIFPYWQSGGDWFTVFVFVNGSQETADTVYIRPLGKHSTTSSHSTPTCQIRPDEQLICSTTAVVPTWIPVTASCGYALFRADQGEPIHAYCVVYNRVMTTGYVVPAYNQDHGF